LWLTKDAKLPCCWHTPAHGVIQRQQKNPPGIT